jgi:hypothetical protein
MVRLGNNPLHIFVTGQAALLQGHIELRQWRSRSVRSRELTKVMGCTAGTCASGSPGRRGEYSASLSSGARTGLHADKSGQVNAAGGHIVGHQKRNFPWDSRRPSTFSRAACDSRMSIHRIIAEALPGTVFYIGDPVAGFAEIRRWAGFSTSMIRISCGPCPCRHGVEHMLGFRHVNVVAAQIQEARLAHELPA